MKWNEPTRAIWKYNKRSGLWDFQRDVTDESELEWLKIFRADEPNEIFKVASRKPKGAPVKKNPTAKKPTPAQLAARKAFAAAAKAGALTKRTRNPAKKTARKPANSTGYGIIEHKTLKYRVQANGPAGFATVADFAKMSEAEQYGKAYADMSGVQVRIVSK